MGEGISRAQRTREWRERMRGEGWVEVKLWMPPSLAQEVYDLVAARRPEPPRGNAPRIVRRSRTAKGTVGRATAPQEARQMPERRTLFGRAALAHGDDQ